VRSERRGSRERSESERERSEEWGGEECEGVTEGGDGVGEVK
jgi:hypothetical protein